MDFQNRTPCGSLCSDHVNQKVDLFGWVDARRDHGDVIFIHLRDWTGIVQVVFNREKAPETFEKAGELREEFCIFVTGKVTQREKGTENPALETGDIEVAAEDIRILSFSNALPFPLSEKAMIAGATLATPANVAEDLRLQYRYLDLRRPSMQEKLVKRHQILKAAREILDSRNFIEVETPNLTKSTPEGARDYLVPSRVHPGCFYALPQSPQLFKQLLMVSGMERYYQVVKCFRDEDLRPNRQPEFTQLDIEAAFINEDFIFNLIEDTVCAMFEAGGVKLPRPFPRMTYREAMDTTGSDRPDLRFGMKFIEATDIFTNTKYSIFKQVLKRSGRIVGINVKNQSENLSKNILQNEYAKQIVPGFGAKGMTWMRVTEGNLDSNIVQFFSEEEQKAVLERFGAENGDVLLMIADPSYPLVCSALGRLRLHVANRLGLIPEDVFCPVWITDFPLFEPTEDGGVTSTHHPFTSPDRTDFDPNDQEELLSLKSRAYDIVVNGEELGGGSIRINKRDVQQKIFEALSLTPEEIEQKFGFFVEALDYGAPPHGGIALGVDRVVSMILGASSIRDVIAFPKNRSAFCPLTQAPALVAREQLGELGLLDLGGAEKALPGTTQETLLEYISFVSRIGVKDEEKQDIEVVLKKKKKLGKEIEEKEVEEEPMYSALELKNRSRDNKEPVLHELSKNGDLFKNAPAVKGDFFKVVNIIE